jgi:alkylhydroperoxidase/carboxymuconolactone decarboxylase family protein YurZ
VHGPARPRETSLDPRASWLTEHADHRCGRDRGEGTTLGTVWEAKVEHGHYHEVLDDLKPQHRELRRAIPEVYAGFAEMSRAAMAPGALDTAVKELVAVAIGVVNGCDG